MNRWLLALITAVVTAIIVALVSGSTMATQATVVVGLCAVFLAWAALWASAHSQAARLTPLRVRSRR